MKKDEDGPKPQRERGRSRDPRGNRRTRGKGDRGYNAWTRLLNLAALSEEASWRVRGRRWLVSKTVMSTAAYAEPYKAGEGLYELTRALLPSPGAIQRGIILSEAR